jgi:hypothetical protein
VEQQQAQPIEGSESAESKAEWVSPMVDRFIAGGAEAGGDTTTDGIDIFS